ncbi:helix-turn-helix transcriptional regulator [Acinetobacter sp. B10A]|uniref:ArsR/SmtB family transcription factor n=1 Tax=Acinetobacter baretiae TaxID=2605383 RepID=UPI001B3C988B|nr:helix-turn-helix transcriptional regulator [Acinetobacter baretiae]MBF7686200.1 helix-turn-helix transcriptional regulator [Acinetobacter baretiae]
MDINLISKALAHPLRRQILLWLKYPEQYFSQLNVCTESNSVGVCAGHIEKKGHVAQSTMSKHLAILQNSGLVEVRKYGQWSYFSRNEVIIEQYINDLKDTL